MDIANAAQSTNITHGIGKVRELHECEVIVKKYAKVYIHQQTKTKTRNEN